MFFERESDYSFKPHAITTRQEKRPYDH